MTLFDVVVYLMTNDEGIVVEFSNLAQMSKSYLLLYNTSPAAF